MLDAPLTELVGNRNIYELWELSGRTTPFKVTKATWFRSPKHFMRVERIFITKWPYGKAWGHYVREDKTDELQEIKGAGTYGWRFVE